MGTSDTSNLLKSYSYKSPKKDQVEKMFDEIANSYDSLNHFLSLGIDRLWRKSAIKYLRKCSHPNTILDVATGTGDLALQMAKKMPKADITGIDISEGMLQIARQKAQKENRPMTFAKEDCDALSYPDDSFDAVTAAFGIRNFQNLEKGLSEMFRVLKPGGMFCVLELTTPVTFPMKQLFHLYSNLILPLYGRYISNDTSAYSYLNKTIEAFPQGETMMQILKNTGFSETHFKRLTFGICTMYIAFK